MESSILVLGERCSTIYVLSARLKGATCDDSRALFKRNGSITPRLAGTDV